MAVSLSVIAAKDSAGTAIAGGLQAQDKSGAGTGPFTLGQILIDGLAGTNMAAVTAANAVKVDGSAVTQPVSLTSTTITGTVAATQSGTWTVQPGNTANTTAWKVDGSAVTQPVSGSLTTVSTVTNLSQMGGVAIALNTGVRSTGTQRVTIATDDLVPVNNTQINGVALATGSGAMNTGTQRVAMATDSPGVVPTGVLTAAAAPGSAIATLGQYNATNPAPTDTQTVSLQVGPNGAMLVQPYGNPANYVSGAITTAMTGTTTTSLIAAPAAGLRNYITQVTVSNSHATVGTDIILQDGSGGTTLYTIPAAAVYGGAVVTFPTPLRQPTTATALFCANVTTGASTKVSASGYKGV
jgi:hypothetical protein